MEREKVIKFLGGCLPKSCEHLYICVPSYVVLNHVENCEEFVQAVKREMTAGVSN